MLAFYYELFPPSLPKLRAALTITTVATCFAWLSSVLYKFLGCQPLSSNWIPGEDYCSTKHSLASNIYEWVMHVATDVLSMLSFFLPKINPPTRHFEMKHADNLYCRSLHSTPIPAQKSYITKGPKDRRRTHVCRWLHLHCLRKPLPNISFTQYPRRRIVAALCSRTNMVAYCCVLSRIPSIGHPGFARYLATPW